MADLKPAVELQAGDIMLDPSGDLRVDSVGVANGEIVVRVIALDGEFETVWRFDPADLCRCVSRPAVTS